MVVLAIALGARGSLRYVPLRGGRRWRLKCEWRKEVMQTVCHEPIRAI